MPAARVEAAGRTDFEIARNICVLSGVTAARFDVPGDQLVNRLRRRPRAGRSHGENNQTHGRRAK